MKVLLLQIDGKFPNLALMRVATHHRRRGDEVILWHTHRPRKVDEALFLERPDKVYASRIFNGPNFPWSDATAKYLRTIRRDALIGGSGEDLELTLPDVGITTLDNDYTDYPQLSSSMGYTQRGCRLECSFCIVPKKEGKVRPEQTIPEIWRGDPYPCELLLLDNDFFGERGWPQRIRELQDGNFKVSFNQGINARMLNDAAAAAIASVRYYADDMKTRRIYTAWDSQGDESVLFRGLNALVRHGVKPDHIMVYMLIGFWPGDTEAQWEYRRQKLRTFGARPYPMPYNRKDKTQNGFQRFVVKRLDFFVTWDEFKEVDYRPERLGLEPALTNGTESD